MKNMKKILMALVIVLSLLFSVSCNNDKTPPKPTPPQNEAKQICGIDPIFADYKGFYENNVSIVEDGDARYAYFTTNKTKNVEGDVIAVRKGSKIDNKWVYGDKKIILETTASAWDSSRVSNPTVIKGAFTFSGETYSYLMAYGGNNKEVAADFQIGFAVSKTADGTFTKIATTPFVSYDPNKVGGSAYGAGEPSLVSFDEAGKVRLFYTYSDPRMTTSRVMDLDCANLNDIKDGGFVTLPVAGIADGSKLLANIGVAWSKAESKFFVVRDRFPKGETEPKTATSLSIVSGTTDWIYGVSHEIPVKDGEKPVYSNELTQISNIVEDDTANTSGGTWTRIYSGAIVTNAFGHTLSDTELEVAFSVGVEQADEADTAYKFASVICCKKVTL